MFFNVLKRSLEQCDDRFGTALRCECDDPSLFSAFRNFESVEDWTHDVRICKAGSGFLRRDNSPSASVSSMSNGPCIETADKSRSLREPAGDKRNQCQPLPLDLR